MILWSVRNVELLELYFRYSHIPFDWIGSSWSHKMLIILCHIDNLLVFFSNNWTVLYSILYVNSLPIEFTDILTIPHITAVKKCLIAQTPWGVLLILIGFTLFFFLKKWFFIFVAYIKKNFFLYKCGCSLAKILLDSVKDLIGTVFDVLNIIQYYLVFYIDRGDPVVYAKCRMLILSLDYFFALALIVFTVIAYWEISKLKLARNRVIILALIFTILISLPYLKLYLVIWNNLSYFYQNTFSSLHYWYTISSFNSVFLYLVFKFLKRPKYNKYKDWDRLSVVTCPQIELGFNILLICVCLILSITIIGVLCETHNFTNSISGYPYPQLNEVWYNQWGDFILKLARHVLYIKIHFLFICNLYFLSQIWFLLYYTNKV